MQGLEKQEEEVAAKGKAAQGKSKKGEVELTGETKSQPYLQSAMLPETGSGLGRDLQGKRTEHGDHRPIVAGTAERAGWGGGSRATK